MKLPTIQQVKQAQSTTADGGLAEVEMSFARWYKLADMPVKTANGWIDLETGIPFCGVEKERIETMAVDIFVATGPVD